MTDRLKIGQEVLIHGYVDEIRKDTIIIRNEGGYFGTVECEVTDIDATEPNKVNPQQSEWEHDHEVLKAYSDGVNEVLGKIRAEIEKAVWEDSIYSRDGADEVRIPRLDPDDVFEIIDKYKAESEPQESEG